MRTEWTKTEGATDKENIGPISRKYLNFFPSVSLTYPATEDLTLGMHYNRRINRPVFQDLSPYVIYVDSLVSLRGNPSLVPEYTHALAASVTYHDLHVNFSYNYTKNKVNQIFRSLDDSNPNIISFVKENLESTQLYSLTLSHPIQVGNLVAILPWVDTLTTIASRYRITNCHQCQTWYYVSYNQSISLPGSFKLDAYINYTSTRVDGVYLDNPISYVNLVLSKRFLNDHLTARIWANDIFDNYRFTGISQFNNMSMDYLSELDWHFAKIVLTWDFGKLGVKNFRGDQISKDELKPNQP